MGVSDGADVHELESAPPSSPSSSSDRGGPILFCADEVSGGAGDALPSTATSSSSAAGDKGGVQAREDLRDNFDVGAALAPSQGLAATQATAMVFEPGLSNDEFTRQ